MEKEFIYDCVSVPRRETNQCYNDIHALMCLTLLCDMKIFYTEDENSQIFRDFFEKKVGFPLKSQYGEQMQNDLITIKKRWILTRHSQLALELMAFIIGLMGSEQKFDRFMDYYASRGNHIFLSVERLLQGLATADGKRYGAYSVQNDGEQKSYFFDENIAIDQFKEFKKLIKIEQFM